ncbi:MAG: BatD family protein [Aliarcobacter sp.]
MRTSFQLSALLVLISPWAGWGQSVAWNDPGPVAPNEPTQIELVFTDCQPAGPVNLPEISGLQVLGQPGRAQSFSMINFQTSSSTTLTYAVRTTMEGKVAIPSLEITTDKGKFKIAGITLNSTGAPANTRRQAQPNSGFFNPGFMPGAGQTPAAPTAPLPAGTAQAEASAEPRNPYAGEIFDVNYRVFIIGNRSGRVKTTPLWDVQNFSAEAWDRGQQIGPGGSKGLQFHTRAMISKAGSFTLPTIRQKLDIETGQAGRSIFFTSPTSQEVEVASEPILLPVEPLPGGAPTGFKGAVGQFTVESKMIPEQVNEGEPVTWTLTLRGTGNWPAGVELPSRTVPTQIRTIQPKLRREFNGIEIFTGAIVEDLVMIPISAGEFELPAVKFVYFDPKKKSYETIEAKPPKILVTKGASGLSIATPPGAASPASTPSGKQPMPSAAGRPNQPLQYGAPGLPRDPLAGVGVGFSPVAVGWLKLLSILPWIVLLGVWWIWAKRRAVLTDPERSRKESLELWKISASGIGASSEDYRLRERTLLVWQKSVAGTLGVEGATPSWEDIIQGGPTLLEEDRSELEKCWMESEEALYGRGRTLAESWSARAMALAQRIDLPKIKIWETLRPRNLLPWVSFILLLLAGGLQVDAAETNGVVAQEKAGDPVGMYRAADFKGAEKIWLERVRLKSTDPIARNDLALANYQLGDKERALAHGLSAYLMAPRTESVAWNLRIFAGAADQLDPAINRLGEDNWTEGLTSLLGVFAWQSILVAGIALAALGGGLWLASGYYGFYRRLFFRLGSGIVLVGAVMALLAGLALGVYGKLADRGAVMIVDVEPLRSIPSELEPQAEKAYPPGSIAHLEKSFLGWSKIRLPNHDMGWIRTEHIVPLY